VATIAIGLVLTILLSACSAGPNHDAKAACAVVYQLQVQLNGSTGNPDEAIALPISFPAELAHSGDPQLTDDAKILATHPDRAGLIQTDLDMSAECYRIGVRTVGAGL